MHQEAAYEFFTGDCDLFPLSLVFIILGSKGNSVVRHAFNTVVADRDPMGILTELRKVLPLLLFVVKDQI